MHHKKIIKYLKNIINSHEYATKKHDYTCLLMDAWVYFGIGGEIESDPATRLND